MHHISVHRHLMRICTACLVIFALASCRSSKKAANETPATPGIGTIITPNDNDNATGSQKKDNKKDNKKDDIATGTNFTARVKISITQDKKNVSTTGTLRMRYNDVIQITLTDPIIGIAEVGRMEISPDNILIIDRINKRYVNTTYEEFGALKDNDITFEAIQSLFWEEAQKSDKLSYTIPAKKTIKLDLRLSNKDHNANWTAHSSVSSRYTKTDVNELFRSMLQQ